jgi:hypothetical protein
VLFMADPPTTEGVDADGLVVTLPADTERLLVTGLAPGAGYDVETAEGGGELAVTLRAGTATTVDDGGVLYLVR